MVRMDNKFHNDKVWSGNFSGLLCGKSPLSETFAVEITIPYLLQEDKITYWFRSVVVEVLLKILKESFCDDKREVVEERIATLKRCTCVDDDEMSARDIVVALYITFDQIMDLKQAVEDEIHSVSHITPQEGLMFIELARAMTIKQTKAV